LQALNDEKQFVDGSERYNVSKLFDLFIAREIVKLPVVASGQVNVNTVNPGELLFLPQYAPLIVRIVQVGFQRRHGSCFSHNFQLACVDV